MPGARTRRRAAHLGLEGVDPTLAERNRPPPVLGASEGHEPAGRASGDVETLLGVAREAREAELGEESAGGDLAPDTVRLEVERLEERNGRAHAPVEIAGLGTRKRPRSGRAATRAAASSPRRASASRPRRKTTFRSSSRVSGSMTTPYSRRT